jgi:prepilin-type N-terminal cleavage/methylation domain-containing protein
MQFAQNKKGFTLIEILVAIVILIIVVGAIYGAFRAGTQSSMLVEESADLNQTARTLLGRIDSELSSIHKRAGQQTDFIRGENSEDEGGPQFFDKISFTTVSHQPYGKQTIKGDVCVVSYSAEYNNENKPIGFYVTEDYAPGLHTEEQTTLDNPDPDKVVQLSALVIGMDCTYLDPDTDEWVDQWIDKTTLPSAVRVELILKSPRVGSTPITVSSTTNLPSWSTTTDTATAGTPAGGPNSAQ